MYQLILKSLRAYHANLSIDSQLKELLRDVEILYEKALYAQCSKVLDRAKKIADKYEKHLQIVEILQWERRLLLAGFHIEKLEKRSDEVLAEEKQIPDVYKNTMGILKEKEFILKKLNTINVYSGLSTRMFMLIKKKGVIRNQKELEDLKKIIDDHGAKIEIRNRKQGDDVLGAQVSILFVKLAREAA
ncbi:MAG: hypothetical protein IIA88_06635 [Bacteroidetes bacterium]|nr:hypothetical protein [Bacteroidota bacterium]